MNKYWFRLKSVLISIIVFVMTNAYLIYIISRYIMDNTIASVIVLFANEVFILLGIMAYFIADTRLVAKDEVRQLRYIVNNLENVEMKITKKRSKK